MEKELQKLVENGTLTWLPWVGDNYEKNRIMFLGESHRYGEEKGSFEKHQNPDYTRICVKEMGVDKQEWNVSLYKNTHRFFNLENSEQTSVFWNKVAFMNIVQRPMRHVGSDRKGPNTADFNDGWASVLKTIEVLKPEIIICFSLSGADKMKDKAEWLYKINGVFAKRAIVEDSNNNKLKIVFLKHPSARGGNAFDEWRDFLKKEISSIHFESLFSN